MLRERLHTPVKIRLRLTFINLQPSLTVYHFPALPLDQKQFIAVSRRHSRPARREVVMREYDENSGGEEGCNSSDEDAHVEKRAKLKGGASMHQNVHRETKSPYFQFGGYVGLP